jgi:hypothetical protein
MEICKAELNGAMKELKEMNKLIVLLLLFIVMMPAGMAFAQDPYDYDEMSDEEYEAILDKGKMV